MKILILSPLFPPDVGAPAPYVKELLGRLKNHHVEALIYGYLPESVKDVRIEAVDKRTWVIRRLLTYTKALNSARKNADVIILNNAPSVELPMLLISLFSSNTVIMCESDPLAHEASKIGFYKLLHTLMVRQCAKVVILPTETLYTPPERLPFNTVASEVIQTQNTWWNKHLSELTTI